MRFYVLLKISRTHLFARFKQTAVAALGVTFGIGTFITMVSFMTGLNHLLDGLFLNSTPHIHLYNEFKQTEVQPIDRYEAFKNSINVIHSVKPKPNIMRIRGALPLVRHLKEDERVRGVIKQVTAQVFYQTGSVKLNGNVLGIQAIEHDRLFTLGDYVIEGSVQDLDQTEDGIILGAGVADKMSVKMGERVVVSNANGEIFYLKIVGIYQSGLAEIDNIQSYVNLRKAQSIMGYSDEYITDINIKLHNMEKAPAVLEELERSFGVTGRDIQSANAQFETGTNIRNIITYSVSIALLIVAGFGIYNILNMSIYEKMNDIAILKATGFSARDVRQIFISQALFLGVVGGLLGLLVGYGLSVVIDHTAFETDALPTIKTFPVNFNFWYYVIGIVFSLISTFLAGYLPAAKAGKIDPVEIFRGQ